VAARSSAPSWKRPGSSRPRATISIEKGVFRPGGEQFLRCAPPRALGPQDAASCALWPAFLGVARAPARLRTTAGSQG
jgi:hypothetical protein